MNPEKKKAEEKAKGKVKKAAAVKVAPPAEHKAGQKKADTGKTRHDQEAIQKPFTNVDEELHNVNKKIKEHSKKLQLPHPSIEVEIQKELSKTQKLLDAAMKLKFYVATYTIALGILGYILGYPKSFFTHFIFGCALLWITHHFHKHRHRYTFPLKVFYIGIMIIPLYMMYSRMDDLMSLVMILLYLTSFVVALALYFHHTSKGVNRELHQSFTRTFLVVWYSHVLALAGTVLLAYFIPDIIIPNSFVSMIYLIMLWIVPCFLLYFFLNKFLYLRFFDPLHIKRDTIKGVKHSLAYTGIFTGMIILIYFLTAINITVAEKQTSLEQIDESVTELQMLKTRIIEAADEPGKYELNEMKTTKELLEHVEQLTNSLQSRKSVVTQPFGIADYASDNYFEVTSQKRLALTFLLINKRTAIIATDDLIRNFEQTDTYNTTQELNAIKDNVDMHYRPYEDSEDLKTFREYLYSNKDNHENLMVDNALLSFALSQSHSLGINIMAPGNSRFSKKMYYTLSHLKIFREVLLMTFENIVYSARDLRNPEILDKLYYNRDITESEMSKTVRYKMLAENLKANLALI